MLADGADMFVRGEDIIMPVEFRPPIARPAAESRQAMVPRVAMSPPEHSRTSEMAQAIRELEQVLEGEQQEEEEIIYI